MNIHIILFLLWIVGLVIAWTLAMILEELKSINKNLKERKED